MDIIEILVSTLWFFAPAYFANGAPLLLYKFLDSPHRIDRGSKYKDGRPLLGAGKTVECSLFGIFIGALSGLLMALIQAEIEFVYLPVMSLQLGLLLGTGAILGDITASFLKRRLGYNRGEKFLLGDQLDFLLGSALLSSLITFKPFLLVLAIFITPVIHKTANVFANKIEFKDVAW